MLGDMATERALVGGINSSAMDSGMDREDFDQLIKSKLSDHFRKTMSRMSAVE